MNMYIFCKITKKIWFGGFNADNYEEMIVSFFFSSNAHWTSKLLIFIQNIMNVALNKYNTRAILTPWVVFSSIIPAYDQNFIVHLF